MATEARDLVPFEPQQHSALVRPLVNPADMLAAIREYEALKRAIIQPSDIQEISGRKHIKKSGWLRIARAFNLTVEPVNEQYLTAEDGTWGYAIVVRAVAPNGASMQGDGMCWSTEKKQESQRTRHNVRAHAYTRATNRAISNLVGGGEVSAEEMQDYVDEDPRQQPKATTPKVDPYEARRISDQLGLGEEERESIRKQFGGDMAKIVNHLRNREKARQKAEAPHSLEGLPVSGMH